MSTQTKRQSSDIVLQNVRPLPQIWLRVHQSQTYRQEKIKGYDNLQFTINNVQFADFHFSFLIFQFEKGGA